MLTIIQRLTWNLIHNPFVSIYLSLASRIQLLQKTIRAIWATFGRSTNYISCDIVPSWMYSLYSLLLPFPLTCVQQQIHRFVVPRSQMEETKLWLVIENSRCSTFTVHTSRGFVDFGVWVVYLILSLLKQPKTENFENVEILSLKFLII